MSCILGQSDPEQSLGAFKFAIDDMARLRRFLVLGVESACYCKGEVEVGLDNAKALYRLLTGSLAEPMASSVAINRGLECVQLIVEYATEGRCAKQNPLVFALAMCARYGDTATRKAVFAALPQVCSIPTTLFSFIEYLKLLRQGGTKGWGRLQRAGIAAWYNEQDAMRLAHSLTKYRLRKGWRHKDVLRLCHVVPSSNAHQLCFQHVAVPKIGALGPADRLARAESKEDDAKAKAVAAFLSAAARARVCTDEAMLVELITKHGLVREHVLNTMLGRPGVWRALLRDMPLTALMRNLNKMTSIGLFDQNNVSGVDAGEASSVQQMVELVVQKLTCEEGLKRARIHPFNVLVSLSTYTNGQGFKGDLRWQPVPAIVAALEQAFTLSFRYVTPTGKRLVLALDVSGSMSSSMMGSPLSSREAAAAMLMTFLRTEEHCRVLAFCHHLVDLPFTAQSTLSEIVKHTEQLLFGMTDCAQPMLWAEQTGVQADAFLVFTDSETNSGTISPAQALRQYRAKMGIDAQLVVLATASTGFSIADPSDGGMMDVAGMDSAVPALISNFLGGKI